MNQGTDEIEKKNMDTTSRDIFLPFISVGFHRFFPAFDGRLSFSWQPLHDGMFLEENI